MADKALDFRKLLKDIGLKEAEYARLAGLSANTVYRRARGDVPIPREVEFLARCLLRTRSTAEKMQREGLKMAGRQRR